MWALVGIYGGQEDNQFFRRADSGLAESGVEQARETFAARQVLSAMVAPVTRGEPCHGIHRDHDNARAGRDTRGGR